MRIYRDFISNLAGEAKRDNADGGAFGSERKKLIFRAAIPELELLAILMLFQQFVDLKERVILIRVLIGKSSVRNAMRITRPHKNRLTLTAKSLKQKRFSV